MTLSALPTATRERAGPFPAGSLPAGTALRLARVSRPWSCRLCRAARGREQGPSPPGLARLGPRNAHACVAAVELSAEPSSEREGAGSLPAGSRRPGPRTARACVTAMSHSAEPSGEMEGAGSLPTGSSRLGPRTACACVMAMGLSAVPGSEMEGEGPSRRVSPDSGRTLSVRVSLPCRSELCQQLGGGSRAPPRRVSPGLGRAQPKHVLRP